MDIIYVIYFASTSISLAFFITRGFFLFCNYYLCLEIIRVFIEYKPYTGSNKNENQNLCTGIKGAQILISVDDNDDDDDEI